MATFVKFWGTRGSIPTPGHKTRRYGGNTSCVELRFGDTVFICDGGTGLRELGTDLLARGDRVEAHLFFSHTHWDHIQGFPFFSPVYSDKSRLYVHDVLGSNDRIRSLLLGQMSSPEYFPVHFHDLGANLRFETLGDEEKAINGVRVAHFEQHHPGRSFAYAFCLDDKKIVYSTDHEVDLTLTNSEEALRDPNALRRAPRAFVEFVEGADLLIADGQYTDEEYAKKVGWGHARCPTIVDLAFEAGVKQLAVFHHDPMHSDEFIDEMIEAARARLTARGSDIPVFGAREGVELKL